MSSSTTGSNTSRNGSPASRAGRMLIAATAAVLSAQMFALSPASAAATEECSGYDYRCDRSGYGEHAATSFWRMTAGHNCTNYVAYRLIRAGAPRKIGFFHNGGDWADDAAGHGIPVDQTPAVGAVAQWMPGAGGVSWAGHVAYIEDVGEGWIVVSEDNYASGPMRVRKIKVGDPEWPSNFIHFLPAAMPAAEGDGELFDGARWVRSALPSLSN